jgi:hypothetical protein
MRAVHVLAIVVIVLTGIAGLMSVWSAIVYRNHPTPAVGPLISLLVGLCLLLISNSQLRKRRELTKAQTRPAEHPGETP